MFLEGCFAGINHSQYTGWHGHFHISNKLRTVKLSLFLPYSHDIEPYLTRALKCRRLGVNAVAIDVNSIDVDGLYGTKIISQDWC